MISVKSDEIDKAFSRYKYAILTAVEFGNEVMVMANGAAVFDTFTIGESLEKVFDKSQTKAIIEAISASRSETVGKAEFREHKAEVKAEAVKVAANIEKHESKVLQAIEGLRHEMSAMEARFDAKFDTKFAAVDSKFDILRTEITWIKWILGILAAGIFVPLLKGIFQ